MSGEIMRTLAIALLLLPATALAQDAAEVRRLFEAGQYQLVIQTADAGASPEAVYTAAQSHQKLGSAEEARSSYARLAERSDNDAWHFIGLSGQQLLDDQTDAALESARQAAQLAGNLPEAHYQVGLVLAKRQDWRGAADAFDRAVELNPANAYAHYYDGLMQYRAGRPDRMAIHFEQFLKLAPEAPERPEVLQIMRTVRGR
jgi:tetratricopeptide (TPR) repeat protein